MFKKIYTAILSFICSFAFLCETVQAERPIITTDRADPEYWQTDRAKLLDNDAFIVKLKEVMALPKDSANQKTPDSQETISAILEILIAEHSSPQGVHIETLLTTVGAMAGFSCQMAIRDGFIATGKVDADSAFVKVETKNGESFFTGSLINECIASGKEGQHSVWGFVGGAAQHLEKPLPDIVEIVRNTAAKMGDDNYAQLDIPQKHQPHQTSEALLWKYWNITRNTMVVHQQPPEFWPFILGMTAQSLIIQGKDVIDATTAAKIVMEAAISMSRLDPKRIHEASIVE